jgi:hypothetical protein
MFPWGLPYLGFVIFVTFVGFWQSYFGPINRVPFAFHLHAMSALTWLGLLAVQTWTIQQRHNARHKQLGKASLLLFPILIMGMFGIVDVTAKRYVANDPAEMVNPAAGIITFVAITAYLVLFYLAMRQRRNARLHGGYLLATPLILWESPASRATGQLFHWPNFANRTELQGFGDSIAALNVIAIVFALLIAAQNRRHGAPWLLAAGFMVVQSLIVYIPADIPGFLPFFAAYGRQSTIVTLAAGLAIGALAGWLGWLHGKPQRGKAAATQPAE